MTLGPLLSLALATPMLSAFAPGEELVFQVKTLGLTSGSVQFNVGAVETADGVPAWPIVMLARSLGMTELLYPIRDRFVSFWNPATGLPISTSLTANEGGKKRNLTIHFRRQGTASEANVMLTDPKETRTFTAATPAEARDLQSAVYFLRTQPLRVGDRVELPIMAGKRQWILSAEVVKAVPLETPAGHFDALLVRLTTAFSGKLQSRGAISAYFSSDERHLPLRFDANLAMGKLTAELTAYSAGRESPKTYR